MKKIIIFLILILTSSVYADFIMKIPLEKDGGGSLPDKSIIIKQMSGFESWVSTMPEYTNWIDNGSIYGCSNWSPAVNTIALNQQFTQNATDCSQDQTRDRQEKEIDENSGTIRNVGAVIVENRTISANSSRLNTGTFVPPQCQSEVFSFAYVWITDGSSNIFWNSSLVAQGVSGTSVNVGGYTYSRGNFVIGSILGQTASTMNYEVCRAPL